jgi:predicted nucleic acid-binding protein
MVLDASAVVDLLLDLPPFSQIIARRVADAAPELYAPHLLDVETAQVLRRFVLRGDISSARASLALTDLLALPIQRYAHAPLIERAFELRDNATMYDALYLVLAEGLNVPLLTRDKALGEVPGHRANVEVLGDCS